MCHILRPPECSGNLICCACLLGSMKEINSQNFGFPVSRYDTEGTITSYDTWGGYLWFRVCVLKLLI